MKTRHARIMTIATCALALIIVPLLAIAQETQTWEYGGIVYRLPIPRENVSIPDGTPAQHTVVRGDCLWAIAGAYLNDPYLWPLIWDLNMDQVSNPHLIYPDQVILLPGTGGGPAGEMDAAKKVAEGEVKEGEEGTVDTDAEAMAQGMKPKHGKMYPLTSEAVVLASGTISQSMAAGAKIIGSELNTFDISQFNICYIDAGSNDGVQAGDRYYAVRSERPVIHPVTKSKVGYVTRILGELEILCVQPESATAKVTRAFTAIMVGDVVQPYYPVDIPLVDRGPSGGMDRCEPPSGRTPGYIIDAGHAAPRTADAVILGMNDVVYIDLGSTDGIVSGDTFRIYDKREDKRLPAIPNGELVVMLTGEKFSTAMITKSVLPIFVGNAIDMK
ncbi:LysM peptidoglycan-binding domain-containing protein [bacterium]|nr:LysM peptidoglycan-binding domain-containing protein [candidate division CSSED10-310 bacterium]